MKFLIIFIVIIGLLMLGFNFAMRKIKRFFSAFTTPISNFQTQSNDNKEEILYDNGKVKVYKGDSKE